MTENENGQSNLEIEKFNRFLSSRDWRVLLGTTFKSMNMNCMSINI